TSYLYDPMTGAMSDKVVSGSTTTYNDYITVPGVGIVALRNKIGTTVSWYYMALDHLGSISAITDASKSVSERLSYDPWGKRRNANGTDNSACSITSLTTRGYTGHEMLDSFCLINMNARTYDPSLGRFQGADSIIPNPGYSQAYNRYAYVYDNPLAYTDPSGHDGGYGQGCDDYCHTETVRVNGSLFEGEVFDDGVNLVWGGDSLGIFGGGGARGDSGGHEGFERTRESYTTINGIETVVETLLDDGSAPSVLGASLSDLGASIRNLAQKAGAYLCNHVIPEGRTVGVTTSYGGITGPTFTAELVTNYNTGQSSIFVSAGGFGGWNGGVSASAFSGMIYNLGNDNGNYSQFFESVSGSAEYFGIFGARSAAGPFMQTSNPNADVRVYGGAAGGCLWCTFTFQVSTTYAWRVADLGDRPARFSLLDSGMTALRQGACRH
ncbi:MAG: RHS repeat-associated core domain-containing protein, partial [Alphaproteobacteria bacterium]|nr:RHS repeat-associated core domain-containing protein [Alphaproteobacteria bacterium]